MFQYFKDSYEFSFQFARAVAYCHFGAAEFFEIEYACRDIVAYDYESWYQAWSKLGDRLYAMAEKELEQGHTFTASDEFTRAAGYYRTAEFYLSPLDERKIPLYMKEIGAFRKALPYKPYSIKPIEIPYEDSFLTAYYIEPMHKPADGSLPPAVMMYGGLDSTAEELCMSLAENLSKRGFAVLAVDGPGQGGSLRLNNIKSRYDYEVPVTACFDFLAGTGKVNPKKIALLAWSMGGYYAPRAAAFEHRLAACVAWGAQYDYGKVWANRPDDHALAVHLQYILGCDNIKDAKEKVKAFHLTPEIVAQIQCPTFIIHGDEDRNIPVADAYRLYDELKCEKKLVICSDKDALGSCHCQMDNMPLGTSYICDWLYDTVAR
ncbi:MAG: alpha/beta fold hydrolase [Oscillospiraceae bacterium]|nr:alpha/beta fold hydrolase [Oscillospiraceae bacterium]